MRGSDLMRCSVATADGTVLGRVSDVRLVQDGPVVSGVQAALRVDALVVGRGGIAERLGYGRGRIHGPWLLSAVFTKLERRAVVVNARDISDWDEEHLCLTLAEGAVTQTLR